MSRRWPFLFIYACSGAAGLVYEVAWTRLLGLTLGHGGQAAGTVLGAYMGGMGLGALAAGRLAPGWTRRQALRAYAILEVIVAGSALLVPVGLAAAQPLLATLYGDAGGGTPFVLARLVLCIGLLAVPTVTMGATFPIAARWFVRRADRPGSEAGGLYAANTGGAAAGALCAGFLLLPLLGLRLTTAIAAAVNICAAVLAWWLATREVSTEAVGAAVPSAKPSPGAVAAGLAPAARVARRRRSRRQWDRTTDPNLRRTCDSVMVEGQPTLAAVILAFSGAGAMAAELAWTRVLALVIGPTSQAFSAMLVTFIGGLALGSVAGTAIGRRTRRPALWIAVSLGAAALSTLGVAPVVNDLPLAIAEAARTTPGAGSFMVGPTLYAVAWMLPMAIAFGLVFPLGLAFATVTPEEAPGRAAVVYAANTAGAIAGSLAAAFLLLPAIGLERTFHVIATVAAGGVALTALARMGRPARGAATALALVAFVAPLAAPRWDVDLLLGGAYKYSRYLAGMDAEAMLRAGTLLWHADGRVGAVSVRRTAGVTALAIDGKVDASNGGDMLTQKLLGHVPLLLHPSPRRVCVIGLGSGVTLGAVLSHPVETAVVVELAPEVVRASSFFRAENGDALSDRRTRLIVGDGRTHLVLSRESYDAIISEPSNPWIAGMSALFTREFFEAARSRLAPGGVMCQWAHTYDMRETDLRSIVATFIGVFPGATLWTIGEGDLLLVGGRPSPDVDAGEVARRWTSRRLDSSLAAVSVTRAFSLLSLLAARGPELVRYASSTPIQTDDRLALEYSAPGAIFGQAPVADRTNRLSDLVRPEGRNDSIGRMWREASASDWTDRGRMLLAAEAPGLAYESYDRALSVSPGDRAAIDGLVRAAPSAGQPDRAVARLRSLAASDATNIAARVGLSRLLAAQGRAAEAEREARAALAARPDAPEPLEQWASILGDRQDAAGLAPLVEEMVARHPSRPDTAYYAGTLRFLEGRFDEAASLARRAVAADPSHARAWSLAGGALASAGRLDEARRAFAAALAANPRDPSAYANLGLMELNLGRPQDAARRFAEALVVDAAYSPARDGLATALDRVGAVERSRHVRTGR